MPKKLAWNRALIDKFWSGVAETRLSELSFSRLAGQQMLHLLRPHLGANPTILDFGAGDGDFSQLLTDEGFRVAVYEPSPGRRESLQQKGLTSRSNFLGFTDAADGKTFDVVLMLEVIEHISDEDMAEVLKTVAAKLATGGQLIVSTPLQEDLDLAAAYCPVCDHTFHRWQHLQSWTSERLLQVLQAAGFDCQHLYFTDFSYHSSNQQQDLQARYDALLKDYAALSVKRGSFGPNFIKSIVDLGRMLFKRLRNFVRNYRQSGGNVFSFSAGYSKPAAGYTEHRGPSQNHLVFVGVKKG